MVPRIERPTRGDLFLRRDEFVALNTVQAHDLLGVRREGVTEGALRLQALGLIRYVRGRILVLDRKGLAKQACECYAVVKKEYDRLLPETAATPKPRPTPALPDQTTAPNNAPTPAVIAMAAAPQKQTRPAPVRTLAPPTLGGNNAKQSQERERHRAGLQRAMDRQHRPLPAP